MELLIIFVVISFLIGTISFALPSKSSKKISELRMNASKLGLKITPSNIGKNSFKNRDVNLMIYSLKNNTNLKDEARLFEKLEEVEAEKWVRHDEAVSIKQKLGVILDEMVQHQQFSEYGDKVNPSTKRKRS